MNALRVVVAGEGWHGSDCTGLARGFRELGHAVELIGWDRFFPAVDRSLAARGARRALSPLFRAQFNRRIRESVRRLRPDFLVVFKGTAVAPETLAEARRRGVWSCNFWPDVSTVGHWGVDQRIFGLFDHLFTTKSFGIADLEARLGLTNVSFLPPASDPLVHRPIASDRSLAGKPEVSFLGRRSPQKEGLLAALADAIGPERLAVWGDGWDLAESPALRRAVRGGPVYGDFYAMATGESRINLGLLSEKVPGASSGDLITARTFQIPASGGFLLHERTAELARYFEEGREVACFGDPDELVEKVQYYLDDEPERARIAEAGHRRCVRENRWSHRAAVIVEKFQSSRHAAVQKGRRPSAGGDSPGASPQAGRKARGTTPGRAP